MRPRALVTSLFAASLALVPSATADAATHSASVKVKVIGRSGKTVPATIDLVDVSTGARFTVAAGKSKTVPTGTYVIGSYIAEGKKLTLAARTVHVDGHKSLTFDARDGKKVTASVNQKHAKLSRVTAGISVHTAVGDLPLALDGFDTDEHPTVYAIPSPGGRARLSLTATLTDSRVSPSPWRFDLARTSKGIPHSLKLTAKKAKLARVDLDLHIPDPDLNRWVDLVPITGGGGFAFGQALGEAPQPTGVRAPDHLRSYRSPGLSWITTYTAAGHGRGAQLMDLGPRDTAGRPSTYRAGHAYSETWGSGIWGATADNLQFAAGGGVFENDAFTPLCLTPSGAAAPLECALDDRSEFHLYSGNTELEPDDWTETTLPTTAPAWYDLQANSTRPAGAATSTSVTARWHLHIDPTGVSHPVERGLISLTAAGLNGHNAATHGSTTRVTMSVDGFDTTASEDLAYSTDGTTWNPLTLTKSGANWIADIPNPATPGGISLRANAAGASGSTVSETITNAWRVE